MIRAYACTFTLSAALSLGLVACSGDDTATTSASSTGSGSTSTAASSTTDASTGMTDGTGPSSSGSASTSGSSSTGESTSGGGTSEGTSAGTTGGSSTGTSAGTTGGAACEPIAGESVHAELKDLDKPVVCGTLTFDGVVNGQGGNTWELDNCPCGFDCFAPDLWSLTVEAPVGLEPKLPGCAKIVVETYEGLVPNVCIFGSMTIWDTTSPGLPILYAAGNTFEYAVDDLSVTSEVVASCPCDGCCGPQEIRDLVFGAGGASLTLAEGEAGMVGQKPVYEAHDLQSHVLGICDAPPSVDWVIRREP